MNQFYGNMDTIDDRRAVVQPLSKFWYQNKVAAFDMLRLDLVHPVVSGNKWYKLRLNIAHAKDNGFKTIVTFGGGFSNHLVATAFAAKMFDLNCVAIVRGKHDELTPTLLSCKEYGANLIFVTKEDYKNRDDENWIFPLVQQFEDVIVIPQGGENELGRKGASLITRYLNNDYTHVITAVGSGTTLVGLRSKLGEKTEVLGFAPFKKGIYLKPEMDKFIEPHLREHWQLFDQWHFGGFGKWNETLIDFMNEFYTYNKIPLDIVYTSKMMYGVYALLMDNYFSSNNKILCIHSGGLQGNVSVQKQLIF